MKKLLNLLLITIPLFSIPLAFSSCDKIKDAAAKKIPNITFDDNNPIIVLPASNNTGQQTQFGVVTFDLNQYIKDNSGGLGDFSMVKHIYVKSIIATILNGDANNNFTNLTFTADSNPVVVFNTTPDYATATRIGGNLTTPPGDPYYLVLPVTNNTDILSHINGKDWAYGFAYKLQKATTKDLQIKLNVKYEISFQD